MWIPATEFWRGMHEPWEGFRIDVELIEKHGDWVVLTVRFRAKGVDSGLEVDMRFAFAERVQDGLVIEIFPRRTIEEARMGFKRGSRRREASDVRSRGALAF